MTQPTSPLTEYREPFHPTDEQKQRAQALKRFNRLYVLTPVIVATVVAVLVITLLLVATLAPGITVNTEFISALADITIMMILFPMILLMISGPLLLMAIINTSRKRRKLGKPAFDQGGGFQVLLWKIDLLIQKSQRKTNEVAPQMANQVIRFNETLAFIEAFIKQLAHYFRRS